MSATSSLAVNNRLLVVDDNPTIHDDFRKILVVGESIAPARDAELGGLEDALFEDVKPAAMAAPGLEGLEIDSASQGREGLARVEQAIAAGRPYAVAFVDMRMPPGWDGVETIIEIWKKDPRLQIVICTAYSDYSWDEVMARVGNHDNLVLLKKPFDNAEVIQLVRVLGSKWMLSEQLRRLTAG